MSVTNRYREAWEGFWRAASAEPGAVFWDAEPALTAGPHLALFEPRLADPALPLVDLGCGNGTQTRFLADRFPRVMGVDLSAAALDHARRADPAGQAVYRQLDAAEKSEAQALHAELGDSNVYMRGVLHQCESEDRQSLVDGIATLVGERGRAFLVELSDAAKPVLTGLASGPDGPPPKLAPVFRHGIAPGEVSDDAVPEFLRSAGLAVLASGELPLATTEYRPDGVRVELPSRWLLAGRTV
ncbi:thiopurine S-methyltransferase superfamily [Streptomyces viridochromogenes DSM 40736]|uniref:Thiopurine S-methyltransferase superfamily n=1 Tax=Streptomyces viridochromogenes (strain DSM 40736 / JCM 4977 / BCRC 1201 / Tue 494) TaxID=591159 RepID=D9X4D0_STRVT|nr:class I SAM-dependent methyltransferase [Streptomyces viridochromogenes]EFL35958.1 thiopurine S-methyltransferase superfamily [Streptomyces viridochromogenes DSM 40736]